MTIYGYTYDADMHCVVCTVQRFGRFAPLHRVEEASGYGYREILSDGSTIDLDEHHIDAEQLDSEANPIHPVFSWNREGDDHCGDCGAEI